MIIMPFFFLSCQSGQKKKKHNNQRGTYNPSFWILFQSVQAFQVAFSFPRRYADVVAMTSTTMTAAKNIQFLLFS